MATVAVDLDGVTLNPNMIWREQFQPQTVVARTARTLGGTYIVFSQQLTAGQKITLEANDEQGWKDMDLNTVQGIQNRAEQVGWSGTLSIGATTYTVAFRHDEPPAFTAEPIISRLAPDSTDLFIMTIKLVVVG